MVYRIGQALAVAILIIAIIAIGWSLFEVKYLLEVSDSTTKSAIIAAVAALAIAVVTYTSERNKARAEAHRSRKVEIYSQFLTLLFGFFINKDKAPSGVSTPTDADFYMVMMTLKRDMILWSSPSVINAFTAFFRFISTPGAAANLTQQSRLLSACLKAMRHDIGLSNFTLSNHFFIEWIIQDQAELQKFNDLSSRK